MVPLTVSSQSEAAFDSSGTETLQAEKKIAQLHFSHDYLSYKKINFSTWAELVMLQHRKTAAVP